MKRCAWVSTDPIYIKYHDDEWGVPLHDDRRLFEKIVLEGAQSGLSWITILKRREDYRAAFLNFEIEKVAQLTPADVEDLMTNSGIIRNRKKIESAINNAKCVLKVQKDFGTLDKFVWSFTNGQTVQNNYKSSNEIPTSTPESTAMSKAMKKYGFTFVGPVTCQAFMQSIGIFNDHTTDCFRHKELI